MDEGTLWRTLLLAMALPLAACRAGGGACVADEDCEGDRTCRDGECVATGVDGDGDADGDGGGDAGSDGGGDGGAGIIDLAPMPAVVVSDGAESAEHGLDRYGCGLGEAPGGETAYRVEVAEEGFLSALLTSAGPGVAGLALLGSLDADDCLDAHQSAVGARVSPGDYLVVVENGGDSFTLQAALTTPATLEGFGMSAPLAGDALEVFANAWAIGASRRTEYVIVDFTLHSAERREWVVDLSAAELLWNLRVAHGRNSTDGVDLAHAVTFSNVSGSNQSSLGLMRAAGTYIGVFGPSFRIEGLEPGLNDNVCDRAIVMHPWAAVNDEYVSRCGWARPSLGCPAIDDSISLPVRDRLARPDGTSLDMGTLLLFWHPDSEWHETSAYLLGSAPTEGMLDQLGVECDSSTDSEPTPPRSTDYACD